VTVLRKLQYGCHEICARPRYLVHNECEQSFNPFWGLELLWKLVANMLAPKNCVVHLTQSDSFRKQIKHLNAGFSCWRLPIKHPVQEVIDEVS
jgi:hypothetical protein